MMTIDLELSSFRDPSGFLFKDNGTLYRQINLRYQRHYDHFRSSGLYDVLVSQGLMIPHQEVSNALPLDPEIGYKVVRPEMVNFISYPYEWSLLHFRGAALTTVQIAKTALEYNMVLKDASAYNIQFHKGRWRLIDTLSFELYQEGAPWVAYKQFCQHFLAPMALMAYKDHRLNLLSRLFIDGVPLDMAARLLPSRTKLRLGLLTHIHLHARSQKRYAGKADRFDSIRGKFDRKAMVGLLNSLRNTVKALPFQMDTSEWADYYENTNYSEDAFGDKKAIVGTFIDLAHPKSVWDLGANTGAFSRLASSKGIYTVAFDIDPSAVAQNYLRVRQEADINLLPLMMDLTNPPPSLGWAHQERQSLIERGPVDLVLALALVHHLAISNNVPLNKLASFFKSICTYLIIEFIPKSDSQVRRLLLTREDIFKDYHREGFEQAFETCFDILRKRHVSELDRMIYLMKVKQNNS